MFQRKAMHMKTVCWLDMWTQIENVPFTEQNPIFDIYIYHGVANRTNLKNEKVIVKVADIDTNNWHKVFQNSFNDAFGNNSDFSKKVLNRSFVCRVNLKGKITS